MKTLSGTFTFKLTILIAVAALAVLAVRAFAQGTAARPAPAELKLTLKFKDADLKDDSGAAFTKALRALNGSQYSARQTLPDGSVQEIMPDAKASIEIKTDKVTKSELAKDSKGELTAIGIHVTQTVTSNSPAEIQSVLDTLK